MGRGSAGADEASGLYRKSIVWGLFIGWRICPTENDGREISEANLRHVTRAEIDLESMAALAAGG